jgi:hypothetical protein
MAFTVKHLVRDDKVNKKQFFTFINVNFTCQFIMEKIRKKLRKLRKNKKTKQKTDTCGEGTKEKQEN